MTGSVLMPSTALSMGGFGGGIGSLMLSGIGRMRSRSLNSEEDVEASFYGNMPL